MEKPKKDTKPIIQVFQWIFVIIVYSIFIGLFIWWGFYCFVEGTTGNVALDIGRFAGSIAVLCLIVWFGNWLNKKLNI